MELSKRRHDGVDRRCVRALRAVACALRTLHPTRCDGLVHLPRGPALLVGDHTLRGHERLLLFDALFSSTGRVPLELTDATRTRATWLDDAREALERGALVVCHRGDARAARGRRDGGSVPPGGSESLEVAHLALLAGVPVIPFAAAGLEETRARAPTPARDAQAAPTQLQLRLLGALPSLLPLWFRLGAPIELHMSPRDARDAARLRAVHEWIWGRVQELLGELGRQWRASYGRPGEALERGGLVHVIYEHSAKRCGC